MNNKYIFLERVFFIIYAVFACISVGVIAYFQNDASYWQEKNKMYLKQISFYQTQVQVYKDKLLEEKVCQIINYDRDASY